MPIDPTGAQVKALVTSDLTGPIVMLNLLRFKPDGGRASYDQYLETTAPFLSQVGGSVIFRGDARSVVIGEDGEWDSVLVVRYPSKEAFLEMLRIPDYHVGTALRTNALLDARLIACEETDR
jgi:uncharacterized protein (DUF1330 family)